MINKNYPSERLKPEAAASLKSYWRKNLLLMGVLLLVWAFAGLGCGIIFADTLNQYNLPGTGYPLGFWFAHQGAIIIFVLIILIYALAMNRLDRVHHEELTALSRKGGAK
ncbi:DUF4212 domain-containing protein [Rubellicoccus peritrichatus]|uniref:DUF4212 domain-containing protein n=1 Tax=Rubellicoccus peritrichatus TaxID=3080537 RepID=A0AAQ3LC48_9BACT|nr:DUF4212 domain-containing protein [Puniceicoccus sp. CR14]WOO41155.1 DUF4212 domain-containing protein [Puniceicoccus sp. CR14]